jgi:hypothetical protein
MVSIKLAIIEEGVRKALGEIGGGVYSCDMRLSV